MTPSVLPLTLVPRHNRSFTDPGKRGEKGGRTGGSVPSTTPGDPRRAETDGVRKGQKERGRWKSKDQGTV